MKDEYQSIKSECSTILKVEGSKFIASAFPVESRIQAEEKLEGVRKKYFDATHNCFAYTLGSEREEFRYSDDGEPSGTAGVKIFSAIQSRNLSDVLVVVTRYFGGVKLGIGGLGRAYFESASQVLAECFVVPRIVEEEMEITFPYTETNGVMNTISQFNARIVDTVYDDDVTLRLSIRKGSLQTFAAVLTNTTRGNLDIKQSSSLTHIK